MNTKHTSLYRIGPVDLDKDVFIIAEIGNNHEGDVSLAAKLIGLAAEAGAHAVKFQSIEPEQLVSPQETARVAQLKKFQLSREDTVHLAKVAADNGVQFMSTPFHLAAVDDLDPLVPAFKIASGDNNFFPLLEKVARTGKPVLMSCGLTDTAAVAASQSVVRRVWNERGNSSFLALLHCVASYPTPPEEANLRAIETLADHADVVGYSDHTLGIDAAVASVALGARVIEKHFTIDKNFSDFRDHQLSADPDELKQLCERVAVANAMLGDGVKRQMDCEEGLSVAARRSVAAARDLEADSVLGADDITWLRPGGGLAPGSEGEILGRTLREPVRAGDMLKPGDFKD